MTIEENGHAAEKASDLSKAPKEDVFHASSSISWVAASPGYIPSGAVAGGRDEKGETLYVARAGYANGLLVHPGKAKQNVCYISYKGHEKIITSNYEILTGDGIEWVGTHGKLNVESLQATPVAAGNEGSTTLYSCRAWVSSSQQLGKVWTTGTANIPYDTKEVLRDDYEVLCYA